MTKLVLILSLVFTTFLAEAASHINLLRITIEAARHGFFQAGQIDYVFRADLVTLS